MRKVTDILFIIDALHINVYIVIYNHMVHYYAKGYYKLMLFPFIVNTTTNIHTISVYLIKCLYHKDSIDQQQVNTERERRRLTR